MRQAAEVDVGHYFNGMVEDAECPKLGHVTCRFYLGHVTCRFY